jgi:PBP1b-binding outer membrane lipoprotein LpoB
MRKRRMRIILGILLDVFLLSGCSKRGESTDSVPLEPEFVGPLTLDESTPMRALLRASDEQITELIITEAVKGMDIAAEDITVEYILRDNDSQAMAVKLNIKEIW